MQEAFGKLMDAYCELIDNHPVGCLLGLVIFSIAFEVTFGPIVTSLASVCISFVALVVTFLASR